MLKTGVNGESATGRWDSTARFSADRIGPLQTAHKALNIDDVSKTGVNGKSEAGC